MTTPTDFQRWHARALELAEAYATERADEVRCGAIGVITMEPDPEAARAALSAHLLAVPIGEPVAHRARVDGMWFHAADKDGLRKSLQVTMACVPEVMEPLFTKPEGMV
jgi:hypothetical protein